MPKVGSIGLRRDRRRRRRRTQLAYLSDAAGHMRHQRVELLAVLFKLSERTPLEHASARQFDGHRVDEAVVDQDLEVDVGPGGKPGRADEANDLSLSHAAADLEPARKSGHMAVGGLITVGVIDAHVFSVTALDANLVDRAVAGGEDRRAV